MNIGHKGLKPINPLARNRVKQKSTFRPLTSNLLMTPLPLRLHNPNRRQRQVREECYTLLI